MTQSYIDPISLQPPMFGQIFTDRTIIVTGQAKWAGGSLTTSGVAAILDPIGGGALSTCLVPDGSYALPSDGYSIWARVFRTAGSHTLLFGTDFIIYDNVSIPKPQQDWIPLFIRYGGQVYAYGGLIVAPTLSPLGGAKASDYDFVVSGSGDPRATHTSISQAISDALESYRILILPGTYSIAAATNGGVDASAAFAWSGKTLTIEGSGWGTQIVNTGSLTRGFGIQSGSASALVGLGNGSRVLNLVLSNFPQAVRLDGNGLGIRNCVVDVWQGNVATFTDPASTGGGTIDDNEVKLRLFACAALSPVNQMRRYYVSTATVLIEEDEPASIRHGTSVRVGGTTAPVYAMDITGDLAVSTGGVHTAASFLGVYDSTTTPKVLKVGSLVTSNSYADTYADSAASTAGLLIKRSTAGNTSLFIARTTSTPASWENYIPSGSTDLRWRFGIPPALPASPDKMTLSTGGDLTIAGSFFTAKYTATSFGTEASPAFNFDNDGSAPFAAGDTGMYKAGSGQIGFSALGDLSFLVASSGARAISYGGIRVEYPSTNPPSYMVDVFNGVSLTNSCSIYFDREVGATKHIWEAGLIGFVESPSAATTDYVWRWSGSTGTTNVKMALTKDGKLSASSMNLSGLTASQVVGTDASKNLTSLGGYGSANTANTFVKRDGSGSFQAETILLAGHLQATLGVEAGVAGVAGKIKWQIFQGSVAGSPAGTSKILVNPGTTLVGYIGVSQYLGGVPPLLTITTWDNSTGRGGDTRYLHWSGDATGQDIALVNWTGATSNYDPLYVPTPTDLLYTVLMIYQ